MRNVKNRLVHPGLFPVIILLVFMTSGCGPKNHQKSIDTGRQGVRAKTTRISGTKLIGPSDKQYYVLGDNVSVKLERISDTIPDIDSIEFYIDGLRLYTCVEPPYEYTYQTVGRMVGTRPLRVVGYYADGRKEFHNLEIILKSDITPGFLPYKVINSWPHDIKAYTQGLIYEDGFLYEGTGQWKESSLRKTEIRTGEPIRMLNLADDVFGEGITILNDRIYQLTYKSQVGFVYEKQSFKRIQKVYYENREGWGLTHDGENLIMSDGSHRIYYMDPEYFTEIRQVEVYNDKGPVSRLNELEFIDGKIFANIYGEEEIVIIEPETGRVTGKLSMKGILPEKDRHRKIDVFNGIAWNPEKKILYVTGKYWPRLFEVSLQ